MTCAVESRELDSVHENEKTSFTKAHAAKKTKKNSNVQKSSVESSKLSFLPRKAKVNNAAFTA